MKRKFPFLLLFVFVGLMACESDKQNEKAEAESKKEVFEIKSVQDYQFGDSLYTRAIYVEDIDNIVFGSYKGQQGRLTVTPDSFFVTNWETPENLEDIRGIDFTGKQFISINSGNTGLIFSGDGNTFKTLTEPNSYFFNGIQFWDDKNGIVYGDPVQKADSNFYLTLFITQNGGQTWIQQDGPKCKKGEAGFSASNTSMQIGKNGKVWIATGGANESNIHFSEDYGKNWTTFPTGISASLSSGIFSIEFIDDKNGIATGGDYLAPQDTTVGFYYTSDGGKNWKKGIGARAYRSCVSSNGKIAIATGKTGTEYSLDNGKTWHPLFENGFYAVVVKENYAWFSGSKGRFRLVEFDF